MSEFLLVYRGGLPMTASASDMQAQMEKWGAWLKDLAMKGNLKDAGHPLEKSGKVVSSKAVNDGPYAEAKDLVGGFSIINAKDLNHAAELTRGCPVLAVGGSVEIRPLIAMPA